MAKTEPSNATNLQSVAGARWSACASGIKATSPNGKAPLDLALLELDAASTVAAVFTQNAFRAAPVIIAQQRLAELQSQALPIYCLINAGNANAGTGQQGIEAAKQSSAAIAAALKIPVEHVLPFSTGVIGEPLPVQRFESAAQSLVSGLRDDGWTHAAQAIMTTDTKAKQIARRVQLGDTSITIMGIAKGAGMIKPNMATMLAYIVTDAAITQQDLALLLSNAVNTSFNRITVDGDTSTNDACLLAATGASGLVIGPTQPDWPVLLAAVNEVMQALAIAIIRDAEGATKFITINVEGGLDAEECLRVAYAVAESPLVKTAFFASDANWGRILAAVGRAGIDNLEIDKVQLYLDEYCICEKGSRAENYSDAAASEIMARQDITITIKLSRGNFCERVWTSDLSHDYVRINAEYRT